MKRKEIFEIQTDVQVQEILDAIMSFAELDFTHKAPVLGNNDNLDALSSAVNMLGEELQAKIVLIHEREMMLREIHHRMKNNLQIVSSILNLQSNVIEDKKIAEKFTDCRERISSMALVHEQLYQSEDMTELEANSYFASLCKRMEHIHSNSNVMIEFVSAPKSVFLSVDQMIPLGLLTTELIINSFKHSFSPKQMGMIMLSLDVNNDSLSLRLSDNGKGFENKKDFYKSPSLGLQLVHTLLEQLEADVEFSDKNPYYVHIRVQLQSDIH